MLYEIHISINIKNALDEIKWIYYCKEKKFKNIRVLNDKGLNDTQYMISKFCNRDSEEEVIKYAEQLSTDIKKNNFDVIRVKVEGMLINKKYDGVNLDNCDDNGKYWEIHFKISVDTYSEFNELLKYHDSLHNEFDKIKDGLSNQIGLSLSCYSQTQYPIITIRLNESTSQNALDIKNKVINLYKKKSYHISERIQEEISIYDTFPKEDEGWIN